MKNIKNQSIIPNIKITLNVKKKIIYNKLLIKRLF